MDYPAGSVVPPSDGGTRSRSHDMAGRIVWISFGISALVHILAVVAYPLFARHLRPEQVAFPMRVSSGAPALSPDLIRLLNISEQNEPEQPKPRERPKPIPRPVITPTRPTGQQESGASEESEAEEGTPLSAAERLRPHPKDARIWGSVDPALTRLSTEERMRLQLAGKLEEWRDSVYAADDAAAEALDWTYTDKSGKKWGVSPGQLHLGGLTLPLPFNFGTAPGNRDALNTRLEEWNEIRRGAAQGAIREGWKERAQAIRQRRDKERAAAKADTSGVKH